MKLLMVLNFIIPFVMILVGYTLKRHPVTDMSRHNGYNTPTSRKSQAHWDYAQSIAPDIFTKSGKISLAVLLVLSVPILFLNISMDIVVSCGLTVGFIFMIIAFFKVEKQIKMKF